MTYDPNCFACRHEAGRPPAGVTRLCYAHTEQAYHEARQTIRDQTAEIAALGQLADPDYSIADPKLPDGDYRCRTVKLGSQGRATLTYVAYPYFRCRVAGGGQQLAKIDGSQRLTGRLYPDTDARSIFLGTMILGDEERSYAYGRDRARDMMPLIACGGCVNDARHLPSPRFPSEKRIFSSEKSFEKMSLICFRNSDAIIFYLES